MPKSRQIDGSVGAPGGGCVPDHHTSDLRAAISTWVQLPVRKGEPASRKRAFYWWCQCQSWSASSSYWSRAWAL